MRKTKQFPYLVGTVISRIQTTPTKVNDFHIWSGRIVHVAKDNKYSLLMLLI